MLGFFYFKNDRRFIIPYPQEHACRIREPGEFQKDSFRRISKKSDGKTLNIIIGRLKGKTTTTTQSYRMSKDEWTESQARKFCTEHDGTFEAAKKSTKEHTMKVYGLSEITFADEAKIPSEIHIVPYGIYTHEFYGEMDLTEDILNEIISNFNKEKKDLVIDYEHQSTGVGELALAAGWITEMYIKARNPGRGIWAKVNWTPDAEEHIKKREYRYISPTIMLESTDKKSGKPIGVRLHSIALTNVPWFDNMTAIAAKDSADNMPLFFQTANNLNKKPNTEVIMITKIREILHLSDDADEAAVITAIEELVTNPDKPDLTGIFKELKLSEDSDTTAILEGIKKLTQETKEPDPDKFVPVSTFNELKESFDSQGTRLKAIETERAEEKAKIQVDALLKSGKILPAQKDWALKLALNDQKSFLEFEKNATVIVNFKRIADKETPDANATTQLHDKTIAIMKETEGLGYSEAFTMAQKQNPELAEQVLAESRNK